MEQLKIFQNPEFGTIRTIRDDKGEPLFCGKDVCEALGYSNGRDAVRKHVDGEDKTTVAICDTGSNYKTNAVFINESGLYALILSSKLESARRFKHWVTSEVLPAIRKQGGYMVAPAGGEHVSRAIAFPSIWLPPSASDLKVRGHLCSKKTAMMD